MPAASFADAPVGFRRDVMAVLSKSGCNAGACHGAAIGRGGFKLSLYGGDPESDYDAIVRSLAGRRINLVDPTASLLLLKPTGYVEHGGEQIFDVESENADLLRRWITDGATIESENGLVALNVSPTKHDADAVGSEIQLGATAEYADGLARDVTRWTAFLADDPAAVRITENGDTVTATVLRPGRHIVIARHIDQVVPIEIIVPLGNSASNDWLAESNSYIDRRIAKTLERIGLTPSPPADDATFLRRVTLDLTGRLPTPSQARSFLSRNNADKRVRLVDQLINSDAFNEYWTLKLAKLFRLRPDKGDKVAFDAYHDWLATQVRQDAGYNEIASKMVTATGDTQTYGPANFYRTVASAREQAELFSEVFMGCRLRCANCHNHPLDRWTQDDYHGLAAIFATVERGTTIRPKPTGTNMHPATQQPAVPLLPGKVDPADPNTAIVDLSQWLVEASHPTFSKAIVNRLWKHMLGRGLVEPVDDFRATNPPTDPVLLDQLAKDFADNGFSLRHTLREIALSRLYAISSTPTKSNEDDARFFSQFFRKGLEPEVMADAYSDVLDVPTKFAGQPPATRAVSLVNPNVPATSLELLGRCDRTQGCESRDTATGGLSQKLHFFNGELINARINAADSRLSRCLTAEMDPQEIIAEFYLAAFSRFPRSNEVRYWERQVESSDDTQALLEDFVWGLLNSGEFTLNH